MSEPMRETSSPFLAGFRSRCPHCGRGRLFRGFLKLRPACEACGLDYAFIDAGDGPAFFVMSIVGLVVVVAALSVEFSYEPSLWVHLLLWPPLILLLSFGLLRPLKGAMIASQYVNKAGEARFER